MAFVSIFLFSTAFPRATLAATTQIIFPNNWHITFHAPRHETTATELNSHALEIFYF
jgi:hypothetical protein